MLGSWHLCSHSVDLMTCCLLALNHFKISVSKQDVGDSTFIILYSWTAGNNRNSRKDFRVKSGSGLSSPTTVPPSWCVAYLRRQGKNVIFLNETNDWQNCKIIKRLWPSNEFVSAFFKIVVYFICILQFS